ncbi:hypothetical protein HHL23_17310 [Chryseobacterium sp. RP-3-3]|uniref:Uncharacterized protein n=1 Tax=Chryseobacterium antibioticum TaxID=2728847 RepID=A0A7Y0AQC9_9FLAO|nr:hypothetical protein [Chryseobacterium antibioticum]NML71545.1 hypothetical protein [Chryseobacterium antibioticum]
MKKTFFTLLTIVALALPAITYAQVGINTSTPDPSAILDVQSTATKKGGLLIPKVSLVNHTDGTTIASPATGLMVYSNGGTITTGNGFYVNYGTPASPLWRTYQQWTPALYILDDTYSVVATAPVKQTGLLPSTIINNVPLGLSLTVNIPPHSACRVIVTYSVPVGTYSTVPINASGFGYYGVRFTKNGVEDPSGSRKYSILPSGDGASSGMVSSGATYIGIETNNTSAVQTVTYNLNGYIELGNAGFTSTNMVFNMWDNIGNPNFNWGYGSMTAQVFAKAQ